MMLVSNDAPSHWYVYLVRMRNNALYCGITTDVARRFRQHQQGIGAKALKGKGPLTLEWYQVAGCNRSIASQFEYRIKCLSKLKKEQIVANQLSLSLADLLLI